MKTEQWGHTSLVRHVDTVRVLVEHGADVSVKANGGHTSLNLTVFPNWSSTVPPASYKPFGTMKVVIAR